MNLQQKHFLYLLLSGVAALPPVVSHSQQVGSPDENIPVTPAPVTPAASYPALYNNAYGEHKHNYIRTWIPDQPMTAPNNNLKHRQVTQYFDGLGRPLQEVNKRAHAEGNDIVTHHVYDAAGRESIQYLPFAGSASNSQGKYYNLPKQRIEQFYPLADGQPPYSVTEYDNSPLNRPVKQMAPGKSWVGSGRGLQTAYRTNTSPGYAAGTWQNPVPTIITIGAFPVYAYDGGILYQGNYGEGQLYITTTTDEDGNTSETVKDKLGRLICTRVLARKLVNSNYPSGAPEPMFPDNYSYTFYVYDKLNRLRAVIPPGAVASSFTVENSPPNLSPGYKKYHYSWTVPDAAQQAGLCYLYQYDERGRTIEKKIPGKEAEYFVYDNRDRLILSQDGNLRQQYRWAFSFYDGLNRPTISGLLSLSDTRYNLQAQVAAAGTAAPGTWLNYAGNYNALATAALYPSALNNAEILSYSYYDNYSLVPGAFDPARVPAPPAGDASIVPSASSSVNQGMLTGTKVKVLDPANPGANQWISTAFFYDAKGRLIQTAANNLKGGTDYNSQLYYFQGMPYQSVAHHHNPAAQAVPGANAALNHIKLDKTYRRNLGQGGNDQVWQLQQTINDGTPYNLAYYDYDHMGRTVVKQYTMANVLQEYNIRGWLKLIHARNPYYQDSTYFREQLYYDDGFASKLYNGNIAGITWNNYGVIPANDTRRNAYGYSYDKLGRLRHAEYRNNPTIAGSWTKDNKDYSVSDLNYDDRGNIQSMVQMGNSTNGPIEMDKLNYTYAANSNKLLKVQDNVAAAGTVHLPDFKDHADLLEEYTYDNNGNLLSDANKAITSIAYTHFNKPSVITVQGKGSITYVYDAMGNRLRKTIYDQQAQTTEVWDYIGSFVYKNNVLQYISNEEGRSRPEAVATGSQAGATKFVYDYFIKDHLGNVRTTLAADPSSHEYFAMHEIATANSEQLLFENIAAVRDDKPGSINPDDTKAARLNSDDPERRIGTAIMLRVMPGDKFTFATDAYYEADDAPEDYEHTGAEEVVSSLLATLAGGTVGGQPVSETGSGELINELFSRPETLTGIQDLINSGNSTSTGPKAGLNYLFFDEQMNLLSGSGRLFVGDLQPGLFDNMSVTSVAATDVGYVIVYVDNQTMGKDVWFDNVQVLHYNTQVLEENHYYPFGLTVSISAMGTTPQPLKYNGKELEKSFGLEQYDYGARIYDSQLGRWHSIDPMAAKFDNMSPYTGMGNNPISYIDPDGQQILVWINTEGTNWEEMTYGQIDNQWGLINKEGKLYDGSAFGNEVVAALDKLRTESGDFGEEFINTIVNADETVKIKQGQLKNQTERETIYANPKATQLVPTEEGNKVIPFDITLGHELDHAFNYAKGIRFDNWTEVESVDGRKKISQSEISAMHVENKLRAARNLPLRTHYSSSHYGVEPNTQFLDNKGRSLFYNNTGKFIFNSSIKKENRYQYKP